jgi:CheY-like chemotaxis protein
MEFTASERRTVLIVEDDSELRGLIVMLFEDSGMEIVECDSAESALATMLLRGREVVMIFPMSDFPVPWTA